MAIGLTFAAISLAFGLFFFIFYASRYYIFTTIVLLLNLLSQTETAFTLMEMEMGMGMEMAIHIMAMVAAMGMVIREMERVSGLDLRACEIIDTSMETATVTEMVIRKMVTEMEGGCHSVKYPYNHLSQFTCQCSTSRTLLRGFSRHAPPWTIGTTRS